MSSWNFVFIWVEHEFLYNLGVYKLASLIDRYLAQRRLWSFFKLNSAEHEIYPANKC